MKCWEYKTVTADSCDGLLPELQRLGRQRWELISVVKEFSHKVGNRYEAPQYVAIVKKDYDPYDVGPYA